MQNNNRDHNSSNSGIVYSIPSVFFGLLAFLFQMFSPFFAASNIGHWDTGPAAGSAFILLFGFTFIIGIILAVTAIVIHYVARNHSIKAKLQPPTPLGVVLAILSVIVFPVFSFIFLSR